MLNLGLGQTYSRVGTPDLEPATLAEKVKTYTSGVALWLEDDSANSLQRMIDDQRAVGPQPIVFGQKEVSSMLGKLPKRKANAISAVVDLVQSKGLLDEAGLKRLRRELENDNKFARFFS
jgi:hypothetical protein